MFRVSVKSQGEDLATFMSRVKSDTEKMQIDLLSLGRNIHSFMQQTITSNVKRPGSTGNLVRSIQFGELSNGGWWVGDIEYLNRHACYWRFLNYGVSGSGMTIPGRGKLVKLGSFAPGVPMPTQADFRGGRWNSSYSSSMGLFTFRAKRPITPINYIEQSVFLLENKLPLVIQASSGKWGGKSWVGAWGKYVNFNKE